MSVNITFLHTAVGQLARDQGNALANLAFLNATLGSYDVSKKISGSYIGHAANIQISAVVGVTTMFNARVWDINGNSIPRVIKYLESEIPNLKLKRREKHPDWSDEMLGVPTLDKQFSDLKGEADGFVGSASFRNLKLFRDERLAHLLDGQSGYRRKWTSISPDDETITYNDIKETCSISVRLISEIRNIWRFEDDGYIDFLRMYEKYCIDYWHHLPVFADMEKKRSKRMPENHTPD